MKDQVEPSSREKHAAGAAGFAPSASILTLEGVSPESIEATPETRAAAAVSLAHSQPAKQGKTIKNAMMNNDPLKHDVLNHANFGLLPQEKNRFGSFGVSLVVNGLIGALILVLTISQVHEAHVRQQRLQLTYLAQPKPYVPPVIKVKMPPIPKIKIEEPKIVVPKPVVVPEPPKVEPIKVETKAPAIPAPVPRPVVQPPAPVVGRFANSTPAPAAAVRVAPVAKAAGFGDPAGVTPNPNANRAATVASVGGFGATSSTSQGAAPRQGVVQGAGFGSGTGGPGGPTGSPHGTVASVGFGSGQAASASHGSGTIGTTGFGSGPAATASTVAKVQQPVTTSIVVLSKPLPQYTPEARELRIEGDVTLEVRFTSTGEVDVLRVVNGLGHGLDEQARLAAQKIRFKPATRDGKPVDQVSVIHVAFQIA